VLFDVAKKSDMHYTMKRTALIPALVACSIGAAFSTESSTEAGYNDGFIVGQARHNNKEAGLDDARIALLSRINSESHAEGGQGRSAIEYQTGWKKGYADGFAGKTKGGGEQKPIPHLPISISRVPKYSYKNIGECKANAPLEQLARQAKDAADKDLFVVDAKVVLNQNSTELVRVIYDRTEHIYLKLTRLILLGEESSAEWVLKIDIGEDELNEPKLWGTDAKHRTVRSKFNEAKTSVPLTYANNPKFTEWP
jgi:hypothetical protein